MDTIDGTPLDQRRLGDEKDAQDHGDPNGPPQPMRERAMAKYGIRHDGRQYEYNRYRYDQLSDAVAYAGLMRSNLAPADPGGPAWHTRVEDAPDDAQRALMTELAISFEAGTFRFQNFRYDHLADAVNYAKRTAGPAPRSPARLPS